MADNFENATQEAAQIFNGSTPASDEPIAESVPQEVTPPEAAPNPEAEEAANVAQVAAQVAEEKNGEVEALKAELLASQQREQALQGRIDDMSSANEEKIVEEMLEVPVLDVAALAFADENTIREANQKYAADMEAYTKQKLMRDIQPELDYARKAIAENEKAVSIKAASDAIRDVFGANSFADNVEMYDEYIAQNPVLSVSEAPLEEKYVTAYVMLKGVEKMNTPPTQPKEPTADELMALYDSNPEFRSLIEKRRIDDLKQGQQVPPFSASTGAVNAALTIKESPKNMDDASEYARQLFMGGSFD